MGPTSNSSHLTVVGCGLFPELTITRAATQAIEDASNVVIFAGTSFMYAFLQKMNIQYTDVTHLYKTGRERSTIYYEIAEAVLSLFRTASSVCYLCYGHPMLFDDPVRLIVTQAQARGIKVEVIPGLSFVDAILAESRKAIRGAGYSVAEATWLVDAKLQIDTRVPLFICQIGAFRQRHAWSLEELAADELFSLIEYLRNFYPADHTVTLWDADSTGNSLISCQVPLCYLADMAPWMSYATTAFLEALGE